jgi:hypothetical protein
LERLRDLGEELDAQRRAALDSGSRIEVGPLSSRPMTGSRGELPDAASLLRRLEAGQLGEGELRALAGNPQGLAGAGVSREELERAIGQLGEGNAQALRDLLDRMARAQAGDRDAEELRRARERITRARESLGDTTATPDSGDPDTPGTTEGANPSASPPDTPFADGLGEEEAGSGSIAGLPGESRSRPQRQNALPAPGNGPVLEARPRLDSEGDVFISEGRALPRANDVRTQARVLDPRFRAQMEEVLASERYPAHYKDYIRRYFLTLSEGGKTEEADR